MATLYQAGSNPARGQLMRIKMRTHEYTKYRPKWCKHPPFISINYCWGLAVAADSNLLKEFLKDVCLSCELYKDFKEERR